MQVVESMSLSEKYEARSTLLRAADSRVNGRKKLSAKKCQLSEARNNGFNSRTEQWPLFTGFAVCVDEQY